MSETSAFLFYSQDFLLGTLTLPMEDRGKYITLLCYMHGHGRLTEEMVCQLVGDISKPLRAKFKTDENGFWYNLRLEKEVKDREKFVKSRRSNGGKGGRKKKQPPLRHCEERSNLSIEKDGDCHAPLAVTDAREAVIPPLPEHVKARFVFHGLTPIEAEYETLKFMAFYTGTGWTTSRGSPVRNWRASVTNWFLNRNQFSKNKQHKTLTEQWLE
ncbi:MAG TPA: hypothetical protein VK890_11810 [Bacteroidia bacterium]|jgi:hypothetical protein|nr:hypothetical protein [Bacteroidia bacterium]